MISKEELQLLTSSAVYEKYALLLKMNVRDNLQSSAKAWLETIPKAIAEGQLVLKYPNTWRDASREKPALSSPDDYSYFLISEKVLVKTKAGEVMCAFYQEDEDKNEKWISACSEAWDITKSVSHWKLIDMD